MKFLVTGGAGSLGQELVTKLLKIPKHCVTVYDNNENNVAWMNRFFPKTCRLKLVLGDVNDSLKLDFAMEKMLQDYGKMYSYSLN